MELLCGLGDISNILNMPGSRAGRPHSGTPGVGGEQVEGGGEDQTERDDPVVVRALSG